MSAKLNSKMNSCKELLHSIRYSSRGAMGALRRADWFWWWPLKHLHIDIDYTSIAIPSSIVREREKILIMAEGSHEQAENPPNRGRAPTYNGSLN